MGKTHEITSVEVIAPYGVLSDEVINYLADLLYPMVMEDLNKKQAEIPSAETKEQTKGGDV